MRLGEQLRDDGLKKHDQCFTLLRPLRPRTNHRGSDTNLLVRHAMLVVSARRVATDGSHVKHANTVAMFPSVHTHPDQLCRQ